MDNKINELEAMGYWIKVKKPHIVIILKTGEINFNAEMPIKEFKENSESVGYLINEVNESIKEYLR